MGAPVVTSRTRIVAGKRVVEISVTEDAAAAGSEWSTADLSDPIPESGIIMRLQAEKTTGTAATIRPRLGKKTGWTTGTIDDIGQIAVAAAYVNEAIGVPYGFKAGAKPILYGRSTPNAGSNNVVETQITIVEAG
jgi:hypothetical protein